MAVGLCPSGQKLPARPACALWQHTHVHRPAFKRPPLTNPRRVDRSRGSTHLHITHSTTAGGAQFEGADAFPRVDAVPQRGASFPATVFNLVNVIIGAGYVSIPFACRQGGWAALLVLWLLGMVFCYTGHTVLQCCAHVTPQQPRKRQPQKPHSLGAPADAAATAGAASAAGAAAAATDAVPAVGYEAVAGAAFGRLGRLCVSGVMYAELLGICCVYIVLEAEALSILLGHTAAGAWLTSAAGPQAFLLAACCLVVPTVLLPSVEALAGLGAVGVTAAVTVGLVVAGLYLTTPTPLTALSGTRLLQLSTLPQVLGVLAFVYSGHSTFPVIQQSMAAPNRGPAAVTLGFMATAAICTLVGGFSYALWGPETAQVVTANLPPGSVLALLLTALAATNPFSAFAVTLEPVALMLQRQLVRPRPSKTQQLAAAAGSSNDSSSSSSSQDSPVPYPLRAAIRLGLALACCVVAALLPFVTDLMAVVGALLTMSTSLILPALMHLALMGRELPGWQCVLDVGVVALGVSCAAVGARSAFSSLQQKLVCA